MWHTRTHTYRLYTPADQHGRRLAEDHLVLGPHCTLHTRWVQIYQMGIIVWILTTAGLEQEIKGIRLNLLHQSENSCGQCLLTCLYIKYSVHVSHFHNKIFWNTLKRTVAEILAENCLKNKNQSDEWSQVSQGNSVSRWHKPHWSDISSYTSPFAWTILSWECCWHNVATSISNIYSKYI